MQENDSREEQQEAVSGAAQQSEPTETQESILTEEVLMQASAEEADAGEGEEAAEAADTMSLEDALAEMQKWKDQALRSMADVENVRLRSQRDVEKAHKFALEKFAADLLPVVDSLEQAQASANEEDEQVKPMLEGIRLTHKLLVDTLARFNVEVVDPHGEPFDPQFHEAMSMIDAPDCEPNTVVQVFQKGFLLNGRVIRAAKVVVSKASISQKIDEQA